MLLMYLQFMRAVGGLVHPMALLQQLEELFHGNAGVRRSPQSEDLPHQDAEGPPGRRKREPKSTIGAFYKRVKSQQSAKGEGVAWSYWLTRQALLSFTA